MRLLSNLESFASDATSLKPLLESVLAKFEVIKRRKPKKTKLQKRDAIIFAAILLGNRRADLSK